MRDAHLSFEDKQLSPDEANGVVVGVALVGQVLLHWRPVSTGLRSGGGIRCAGGTNGRRCVMSMRSSRRYGPIWFRWIVRWSGPLLGIVIRTIRMISSIGWMGHRIPWPRSPRSFRRGGGGGGGGGRCRRSWSVGWVRGTVNWSVARVVRILAP